MLIFIYYNLQRISSYYKNNLVAKTMKMMYSTCILNPIGMDTCEHLKHCFGHVFANK